MNIVGALQEASRKDYNPDRAKLARNFASRIVNEIKFLQKTTDSKHMVRLNGLWVQAEKLLEIMGEPAPHNPRSDEVHVDERRVA